MKNDYIIYDYITFTSKIDSHFSIVEILGLENVTFENLKGFYGYRYRLFFNGISIHYDGRDDMGICVEMSGKGCRAWEKYGNSDYDGLFARILENYSDDSQKRNMNITRIDIAYDDFNGVLDLPTLCHETQLKNFVSRFKDWQVIFGNKGISVNHGSTRSNVYIRIYDKRLEQNAEEVVEHWVRCEIQMRKECALGFIRLKDNVKNKYFMVLNNYLRYIVPTENESNSSMLDTAPYWLNFIEFAESRSIFHKPADNYNFDKLFSLVNTQFSGAISTYIDVVGVEQFLVDINNSRKGKKLNIKYQNIKDEYQANTNGILEYLKKHEK